MANDNLVLNQSMVFANRDNFRKEYYATYHNPEFGMDLVVNWMNFKNEIESMNEAQLVPIELHLMAIRFIHRYDEISKRWFVTCEICQLIPPAVIEPGPNDYTIVNTGLYIDIRPDGTLGETDVLKLSSTPGGEKYGIDYFNNVYYQNAKVVLGVNVQSTVFAWNEFLCLNDDNVSTNHNDPDLFSLTLAAASPYYELPSSGTLVNYPHCINMFMKYNGSDCLNDEPITPGDFKNKAANLNSLCPNNCSIYSWPSELPTNL